MRTIEDYLYLDFPVKNSGDGKIPWLEDGNQDAWAEYSNRSTPFSPEEKEALFALHQGG
jgi:hypothetical protein